MKSIFYATVNISNANDTFLERGCLRVYQTNNYFRNNPIIICKNETCKNVHNKFVIAMTEYTCKVNLMGSDSLKISCD